MSWIFKRRTEDPDIPPPPEVVIDHAAASAMNDLVAARARRGKFLTRQTQHAIAQNHFAQNMKKAMEGR